MGFNWAFKGLMRGDKMYPGLVFFATLLGGKE
jgi:hypothetical protein